MKFWSSYFVINFEHCLVYVVCNVSIWLFFIFSGREYQVPLDDKSMENLSHKNFSDKTMKKVR